MPEELVLRGTALRRYKTFVLTMCIVATAAYLRLNATAAQPDAVEKPHERWAFTTKNHFSFYALLALAPIYRDQIEGVLLDSKHVYASVELPNGVQFLALDRTRGNVVWRKRIALNGYPIRGALVRSETRLIAALFDVEKKELVVIGMNPLDGTIVWQVSIPGLPRPAIYEKILDPDPQSGTVNVYSYKTTKRNRVVLRANDGQRLSDYSYNGYLWPYGSRRAAEMILGYHGIPDERKYKELLAFHESTGQLAWALPLSPPWSSPPVIAEKSLLITTGSQLLKIDLKTGQPLWAVELGGRIPIDPDPPVVIGSKIIITHAASANPEDNQQKLSIVRLADGKQEARVDLYQDDFVSFRVLQRMGDLVIVKSGFLIQIVDAQKARVLATLDFEKSLSWFIYSDPPSMHIADSDSEGFAVVTSDGKLRYFAAEDFRGGTISRAPAEETPKETPRFSVGMIFFYLVVNPLWNLLQANRTAFWVMFYGFPVLLFTLLWLWKPLWAWLRRLGVSRGAKWGGWIGFILALPAAIYRGLMGGIAAGFGSYGAFGPIWGAIVGFATFAIIGTALGICIGSLSPLLLRRSKSKER
ncbi:MAG: PQQ-binding-like beta-propeller repeat protein [Deltaproteobacteria bacterium]|nr:PQQ-binding-like beta-propeller repeat protein [Deltaproteobacteria bacterium]